MLIGFAKSTSSTEWCDPGGADQNVSASPSRAADTCRRGRKMLQGKIAGLQAMAAAPNSLAALRRSPAEVRGCRAPPQA